MVTEAVLVKNLTDMDLHGLRGKSSNLCKILLVHHLKYMFDGNVSSPKTDQVQKVLLVAGKRLDHK